MCNLKRRAKKFETTLSYLYSIDIFNKVVVRYNICIINILTLIYIYNRLYQ